MANVEKTMYINTKQYKCYYYGDLKSCFEITRDIFTMDKHGQPMIYHSEFHQSSLYTIQTIV
jgi:hypothetical protein